MRFLTGSSALSGLSAQEIEGLCILLKRLAFLCRYADIVLRFGRNPIELSLIFNHQPMDLLANLNGPYEGRRHDGTMLRESGLLTDLQRIAWIHGQPLCLHGDLAYPLSSHSGTL